MAEEKKTGAAADDKRTADARKKQAEEREQRAKAQEEHRKINAWAPNADAGRGRSDQDRPPSGA